MGGAWGHREEYDCNNPAIRLNPQKFSGKIESTRFTVRPLVTDLAAGPRLIDADGHGPTFRTEHPFLDYFRIRVGAVHGLRRRSEAPCHDHVRVTFGLQRQLAHRIFSFLIGFIAARTSSSRS